MIPYDTKNYRASTNIFCSNETWKVLASVVGVLIIVWMIKLDRETLIDHVMHQAKAAHVSAQQCNNQR